MLSACEREIAAALNQGRLSDARQACDTILAARPDNAIAWFNLGYVLRCQREFTAAETAYAQAIACGVDRPEEAHINRAAILMEHLLQPEAAEAALIAALKANPHSVPALLTLAQLHEDHGRAQAAEETYLRLLGVAPTNGRARARLAVLAMARGDSDTAIPTLQQAARTLPAGSDDLAEVVTALGQAFEKKGRFQESFAAYHMAKSITRQLIAPADRYAARAVEEFVNHAIENHSGTAKTPEDSTEKSPIFICGMLRSGSTLAERILSQHPRVTAGGELETIPALTAMIANYPAGVADLSTENLAAMRAQYRHELQTCFGAWDIMVDKRPDNFMHIGLIKALFPSARIINTVRHRDDTMLSLYANLFGPAVPYAHSLSDIRHWQGQHDRIMAHWRAVWPDDIYTLEYESLIRDPRTAVGQLLKHCGLDWHDGCLALPSEGQSVRTLSQWQVREAIHARSAGRAEPFGRWLHLS